MDRTCKGLIEHWDWAAKKGLMNKNSAGSLRAACTQVLSAVDGSASIDIDDLDIDDAITRFNNLKARNFTPKTVKEYGKRFERAVHSFRSYISDPSGWKPSSSPKSGRKKPQNEPTLQEKTEVTTIPTGGLDTTPDLISYPFPLRPDRIAHLNLPNDLTADEVQRLNKFMEALVVDFEQASPDE